MVHTVAFQKLQVPSPGFGAMSLSGSYGEANDEESLQVLKKALDMGCTFWDTAIVYGFGHNEALLGRFFRENPGSRENVFVGTKCGWDLDLEKKENRGVTNKPDHILSAIEGSIERLGSAPDLFYLHRIDPTTPIEESVKALNSLKESGKVKYIGLSEPSADTLRKALKVAHIDALQIEYSPWFVDHERDDLIDVARENGVTVVAYSPLGKGVLTGKFKDASQFANDIRSQAPRFSENFKDNLRIVEEFERLSKKKGCTPGQLSIAWVAAQGAVPIPGTKNAGRLEENFGATNVELSEEDLKEIRKAIQDAEPKGDRYGEHHMSLVGQ